MNTKKTIKFSILMANFNNAEYIEESINSVLNQTYKNWELIVVDDMSTDNSLNLIKKYLNDERIKLIVHKENLGCGATKKTAADNAIGDILGILDSDDVIAKDSLEKILNVYIKNSNIGFVYTTHYQCDRNLKIIRKNQWVGSIENGSTNLHKNKTSAFRTFKKSAYNKTTGFNPKMLRAVDKDIIYKIEEKTVLFFLNKPLYFHRIHNKGISSPGLNFKAARGYASLAKYYAYKRRLKLDILNLTRSEMAYDLLVGSWSFFFSFNYLKSIYLLTTSFALNPVIIFKIILQKIKHFIWLLSGRLKLLKKFN